MALDSIVQTAETYLEGENQGKKEPLTIALFLCQGVVETDPDNLKAHHVMAISQYGLGNYAGAIESYNKAIQIRPDLGQLHEQRSYAHFSLDNLSSALVDFSEAIALNPKNAHLYFVRGTTYRELEGFNSALQDYTTAIQLRIKDHPNGSDTMSEKEREDLAVVFNSRGHLLNFLGRYDKAATDLCRAIRLSPVAGAYSNKGNLHAAEGFIEFAKRDYETELKLFDSSEKTEGHYIAAIRAERGLIKLGVRTVDTIEAEGLDKGIVTPRSLESLNKFG